MSDVFADKPDWIKEKPRQFSDPSGSLIRIIRNFISLKNVGIGAGTKLLGGITLGDIAINDTVVGIPAKSTSKNKV